MTNSAESVTSGVYAPFTQQGYALLFECARKVWTYHGVPSMQSGVFWPGKWAVVAGRQACAERTHFCEGVVEKLGDLETSTRPSRMYRQQPLCQVCGTEVLLLAAPPEGDSRLPCGTIAPMAARYKEPWVKQQFEGVTVQL